MLYELFKHPNAENHAAFPVFSMCIPPDSFLFRWYCTHLYTWVERGTVGVKCLDLAQEHNAMSPARARTCTTRSGDEPTNHEVTAPPKQTRCKYQEVMLENKYTTSKFGVKKHVRREHLLTLPEVVTSSILARQNSLTCLWRTAQSVPSFRMTGSPNPC